MVAAFDKGFPAQSGEAIRPATVADQSSAVGQPNNLFVAQKMHIVMALAHLQNPVVDGVKIRRVVIVVAEAEIHWPRRASHAQLREVASDFLTVGDIPADDRGVKVSSAEFFEEAQRRYWSGLVEMKIAQPRDAGRRFVVRL